MRAAVARASRFFQSLRGRPLNDGSRPADAADKRIVFVHGLGSTAQRTWGRMSALAAATHDLKAQKVDHFEYPTAKLWFEVTRRTPRIEELAGGLLATIRGSQNDSKQVTVVAHSLGGLVAMECALQCIEKGIPAPALLLYAVPETGSQFATAIQGLQPQHAQIAQLAKDSEYLERLKRRWLEHGMDERIRTLRVTGGMDGVVPADAGIDDPRIPRQTLLGRDHTNIVQPTDSTDIVFEIFRTFTLNNTDRTAFDAPARYKADPLFDIYTPRHAPYYIQRPVDERIQRSLFSGCTWILGESGLGKTVSIRRNVYAAGWRLRNIQLGGLDGATPTRLLQAIHDEISGQIGVDTPPGPDRAHELMSRLRGLLRADMGASVAAYLIDELPLSDPSTSEEFVHLLMDFTSAIEADPILSGRVAIAFASIAPPSVRPADASKFWERFRPVRIERWSDEDLTALVDRSAPALGLPLSAPDRAEIVNASGGSPRVLKKIISRMYHTDTGTRDLRRAIAQVLAEEL